MTPGWHCPTVMTYGGDGLAQWLGTRPERSVALLLDGGVAEAGIAGSVRARIERGGRTVRTVVVSGPGTPEAVTELAGRIRDADLVAAVGGGSLLDQAKLAVLLRADPTRSPGSRSRSAAGWSCCGPSGPEGPAWSPCRRRWAPAPS